MAPELLRYGKMAPTCDVYSFGVMSKCTTAVYGDSLA